MHEYRAHIPTTIRLSDHGMYHQFLAVVDQFKSPSPISAVICQNDTVWIQQPCPCLTASLHVTAFQTPLGLSISNIRIPGFLLHALTMHLAVDIQKMDRLPPSISPSPLSYRRLLGSGLLYYYNRRFRLQVTGPGELNLLNFGQDTTGSEPSDILVLHDAKNQAFFSGTQQVKLARYLSYFALVLTFVVPRSRKSSLLACCK